MIFTKQNSPRWLIFLIDISIVVFSVLLAYLLRFNFSVPDVEYKPLPKIIAYIILVRSVSFLIARSYAAIIRYTNIADALRLFSMIFLGSTVLALTNIFTFFVVDQKFFIPYSIIIIDLLITFVLMVIFRMLVKIIFLEFQHPERIKANVIIYGAGETGITAKRTLERDAGTKYTVLAFLDDDPAKIGKKLEGVDIMG